MGAGVMLAGFVAGNIFKAFTIDNARNALLFVDEIREKKSSSTVVHPKPTNDFPEMENLAQYVSAYNRESPPPPPPSEEYARKRPVPVAISMADDDFYEKINEEAMAGRSLVDNWVDV
jgi:hypothetical protein